MKIQTLNKISPIGLDGFGEGYTVADDVSSPDAILVRSAAMHDMEFGENLLAIARAGAGVNNIPVDKCADKGIVVFNTPGANANAVKELAIASMLIASRDIVGGINWAKQLSGDDVAKQVEKGKSQFVGPEILGKNLGVIGLGAIGVNVANTAYHLGMNVYGYDPYISLNSAWNLSHHINKAATLDEIFENCHYICIHAPLTDETRGFINKESIALMKNGVIIINLSRADLVNDDDIAAALESGKVARYVTDFPNPKILKMKNAIPVPHLGASTPESEDNCAVMAVKELKEYIENGNIINSVNFPTVELAKSSAVRICVLHKNIPNTLSSISSVIAGQGINISNMINKSKGEYAYTILDCDSNVNDQTEKAIMTISDVIRVRII